MNKNFEKYKKVVIYFLIYYVLGLVILTVWLFLSSGGSCRGGPTDYCLPAPSKKEVLINLLSSKTYWIMLLFWPAVLIFTIFLFLGL
jgi:hypothetical protein